jgi:hypothetical protein
MLMVCTHGNPAGRAVQTGLLAIYKQNVRREEADVCGLGVGGATWRGAFGGAVYELFPTHPSTLAPW